MLRGMLAALAGLLLIGVLGALIVESRAVGNEDYAAHAERMRAIEISRNDLSSIMQGAKDAYVAGRSVPLGTDLALTRLADNNTILLGIDENIVRNESVANSLSSYDLELTAFTADSREFIARQNAFASALRELQEESPLVVRDLRRYNQRAQAQNTFTLALNIIEYATGTGNHNAADLSSRVAAIADDPVIAAELPGALDTFIESARQTIEQRAAAAIALEQIASSSVPDALWTLSNEILDDNRRRVSRAERAGLLLAVCTILLLIGTGYAMFRLQSSYRDLNRSNRELESVNNSLEERVEERTSELSSAYDDLKESQVQLVQAEKMSSLGELVAGISHEINTPLWYLISNSTVVKERLETLNEFCDIGERMILALQSKDDDVKQKITQGLKDMGRMLTDGLKDDVDEARDLIDDSIEGLEELTELAQSLKDFSRLDRARHDEFNVNDGLDKALLIAKNKLKSKVSVHKYYGEVPDIHCSPSQINQVFLNLLTNAADAIEESGEVIVHTSHEGDHVHVRISDTGHGIPKEVMQKIRDPFFTTKEVGKGTGLGLSIVDQIVTSHGGELIIESEEGSGTAVTVVLPLEAQLADEGLDDEPAADPAEATSSDESIAEPGVAIPEELLAANEDEDEVSEAVSA